MFVCIFAIFSKMFGLTRLKFSGGDRGQPGVVYSEFGEDQSKIPTSRVVFSKYPWWRRLISCMNNHHSTTNYNICKHSNEYQPPKYLSFSFHEPCNFWY